MNPQNLTQKSLEAVQTAQSMALENRNNYIMPEHLLYALIDQDGGLIPSLLGKMGSLRPKRRPSRWATPTYRSST